MLHKIRIKQLVSPTVHVGVCKGVNVAKKKKKNQRMVIPDSQFTDVCQDHSVFCSAGCMSRQRK